MVEPRPFIRPATADKIKALKRRGLATTQALQDPPVTVTFKDRNPADSNKFTSDIATAKVIRIRLDDRDPNAPLMNQGASETRIGGSLKAWATDVASVQKDHRFEWNGHWCIVTVPDPPQLGYITIQFEMLLKKAVI